METLRDMDLIRGVSPSFELRSDGDPTMPTMVGHFSVFNNWYEIDSWFEGRFLESIAPGSFQKTMKESRDNIKVLYDHGHDFNIGNKVLGSIDDLREDDTGAYYEVGLLDVDYVHSLLPGLEKNLYGSSFRFRITREEWNDEPGKSKTNPDGIPERTIKEVRLFEFGPVTFPANPAATAGVRSLTDAYYERVRARSPEVYEDLAARARALRTPDTDAAPQGTSEEGAAGTTDAPADSHPSGLSPAQRNSRLRVIRNPFLKEAS